jgi:NAD(P)-dependent dehydrogenase (short-subunit alcohol dehydrogenase family)
MKKLNNKVVIITGAGSGVGREAAIEFASQGAKVFCLGRNLKTLDETCNIALMQGIEFSTGAPDITPMECDVSKWESVKTVFQEILRKTKGNVDILVNNAAAFGSDDTHPLEDVSLQTWHDVINTNINGTFYCTRMVMPAMKKKRSGHIVNISSIASDFGYTDRAAYATSKAAVNHFTVVAAAEAAQYGICVNAIAPGHITGERYQQVMEGRANSQGASLETVQRKFKEQYKLNKILDPSDVVQEIMHLTTTSVGSKTTGEIRYIRCGFRL